MWEEEIDADRIPEPLRMEGATFVVVSRLRMRISVESADGRSWDEDVDAPRLSELSRAERISKVKVLTRRIRRSDLFEPNGDAWLTIQDRIRPILCDVWDPVHVGLVNKDEYDGYIGDLYGLLRNGTDHSRLVEYLIDVEMRIMEQGHLPGGRREEAARLLLALDLPIIPE